MSLQLYCRKHEKIIYASDLNEHSCLSKRIDERNGVPIICPSLINMETKRPFFRDYFEGKIPLSKTYQWEKELRELLPSLPSLRKKYPRLKGKLPMRRPSKRRKRVGMPLVNINLCIKVEGNKRRKTY